MTIKITIPNTSSDTLTFGSNNTPTAAQIAGIDSGSSNGQLAIYTTASGTSTERVRVDSSGNVGIGTSSPAFKLNVYDATSSVITASGDTAANVIAYRASTDASPPALAMRKARGTIASPTAVATGDNIGSIFFQAYGGTNNRNVVSVTGVVDTYTSDTNISSYLTFSTSPSGSASATERMRIDSSGNLLVGTTTSGGKLTVTQSTDAVTAQFNNSAGSLSATIPGIQVSYGGAIPNNTGQSFLYVGDYSALRAQIRSNGGLANYSANNVNLSDRREKTNFAPAKSYLDVICAIPVQTFNYIDQNLEEDDGLTLGVIAQDVQAVAPELVSESNWGTEEEPKIRLSIYQTDLQYALMKCIQEQQALITALTARIEALEAK